MRRNVAIFWLAQIALPGAVAGYALFQTRLGPLSDVLWLAAGGSIVWVLATAAVLLAARGKRPILLRAGVSVWVMAITWSLLMFSLRLSGVKVDIRMTAWRIKQALAGRPVHGREIGIFAAHPRYGWTHKPGTVGQHDFVDFSVTYTIDNDGFRVTRTPGATTAEVLCLGCSFTFGHGLADHEPYAAVLADQYWTDVKVRNGGVNGWGTAQALLFTEDYLANHKAPVTVLYGWIPRHAERNSLRTSWRQLMAEYGRKCPYFEVENDMLMFRGLRGLEDRLPEWPELGAAEADSSARLLTRMGRVCQEHGTQFVVVLLPYAMVSESYSRQLNSFTDEVAARVSHEGLSCVDIRQCTAGLARESLYFAHDPHPRPLWNELVARALAEKIVIPGRRPREGQVE